MSKWLAPLGYRLEMRTARAMHKAGLDVRCSDYYIDPEIGKAREQTSRPAATSPSGRCSTGRCAFLSSARPQSHGSSGSASAASLSRRPRSFLG